MTMLADLPRDFRYAARSLSRTPSFTVVAVVVLALGIGATSAIFSLVSAVWLKPLPFADAERIVSLWTDFSARSGGAARANVTPRHSVDWRDRSRSFEQVTLIEPVSVNVTSDGAEPERLEGLKATDNLFATIGLAPLLGRTFAVGDGLAAPVVVSETFWLRRLGGDPAAVGRTITLDGAPHVVVGVVPREFNFPRVEIDVFIATAFPPEILAEGRSYSWNAVAKLRPEVSLEQARTEMRAISAALEAESPDTGRGAGVAVVPLREDLARGVSPTLTGLLFAVGFVLLIACANVANLLLARATQRQRELAIRKALGAASSRVLRQLLTENLLLVSIAVILGLGLAVACFGYLTRLLPATLPDSANLVLDWRALALTIAAAAATVLLFGAGPAFSAARRDAGLVVGRSIGSHGMRARRLRTALVVAEIALTVVLLAGAGLLLRSYAKVLAVDPGFDPESLLLAATVLPAPRYPDPTARDAFYQRVLENVRALPGVESAGYTNFAPLVVKGGSSITLLDGQPFPGPDEIGRTIASNRAVSPGYLEMLRVPLLSGRLIDARDTRSAPGAVVINQTMARTHWPDRDPIGQRFRTGATADKLFTVVGVVGDIRQYGLHVPAMAETYMPLDQVEIPFMWSHNLVVRAEGDPLALAPAVRRAVWSVDPQQPVSNVTSMREVLDAELANRNTQLTLIGAFAVLAVVLAAVGLYGVLSYTVSQSVNEIGLRMALGAEARSVVGSVLRSALSTALLGIGVGLVGAFALTRTIASFLYDVSPTDPATAAAVVGVLLVVAALAAFVPARRAATINPMVALRADG